MTSTIHLSGEELKMAVVQYLKSRYGTKVFIVGGLPDNVDLEVKYDTGMAILGIGQ